MMPAVKINPTRIYSPFIIRPPVNSLTKTSIALLLIILTSLSSIASENLPLAPTNSAHEPHHSSSSVVVSRRETLGAVDREKYRLMSENSRVLATHEAAGASATTKTVLIVVGVVVVVLVVVAVGTSYSKLGNISYSNPG